MPVRKSKVMAKIRAGEAIKCCALGHFMPFFVHYAAKNGYDCIWLDLEHRAMNHREVQALLQLGVTHDIDIMVRSPSTERTQLYRYFEDGATGVMLPLQNTAEDVASLVEKVKFPPIGNRGIDAAGVDAAFGDYSWGTGEHSMASYCLGANRETFLTVQIETRAALANCEAMAKVEGLDIFFIGPGDLGWRLSKEGGNVPGAPDYFDGGVAEATLKVAAAAKAGGIAWGLPVPTAERAAEVKAQGAQFINLGGDFGFCMSGLAKSAAELDEVLGSADGKASGGTGKAY
eukprot:m.184063 g.184063  ORF g.184063 m.184063 type:complete len:288 (-) comp16015_c0_seq1:213-1076(-)